MTYRELEELLHKLITAIRQSTQQEQQIVNEDFAKQIVSFINTLWQGLRIPEDLKARLVEMIVDYTLRATLRVSPRKRKENEDNSQYIPSTYFI